MNVEQLKRAVEDGSIDTVLLVFTDMQGRLQGKRLVGKHFVDEVLEHDAEACNYLLAVDVDMNTVEGYTMSSWSTGYGDFVMKPHLETLRPVPWHEKTAMCMADLLWHDESPVVASPRQILRAQLDRLAERGWSALAATELEFIVFRDTYEEAFDKGYKGLVPGNQYNVDYSILGTSRLEPLIGRIRREMAGAGLEVENSKGECNFGQHEINFTYEDALGAADTHVIYKNGAKEIASQEGMAITFMAKYDEREGNSCHVHLSLRGDDGAPVFADQPEVFDQFLAGQLACMRDLTLFLAPNINSYKRYAEGSLRPHRGRLGPRQPHVLDAGHRPRAVAADGEPRRGRRRQPLPRDRGDDRLGPARDRQRARARAGVRGQRLRRPTSRTCRPRCRRRATCSAPATSPRQAFGEDVVAHYLNNADVELRAFGSRRDRLGALAGVRAAVTLAVLEPATEAVLAEIPRAGIEETDAAVARAKAAYPAWRAVAPGDRAALLHRLADALAGELEPLAVLEARNAGKPIGDARGEMQMVVDTFRYYAAGPERNLGDTIPVAGGVGMTFREPLGVVALITPWNFPLDDRGVEARAGARGRQHGRAQAGRADPADRAGVRADRARGRDPGGRRERRRRAQGARAGSGSSSTPTWRRSPSPARPRSGGRSPPAPRRRSSA